MMTMAPGIEAAASPHGRAAAAAAAAAVGYYPGYPEVHNSAPSQLHHSSVQGVAGGPAVDPSLTAGHPVHGSHESFDAAASRYYQMQYESAQGMEFL